MTKYIGETIKIKTAITNPDLATPINPTSVTISIWPPDPTAAAVVAEAHMTPTAGVGGSYEYYFDSSSIAATPSPGSYTFRITAVGSAYRNWEFGTILFNASRRS